MNVVTTAVGASEHNPLAVSSLPELEILGSVVATVAVDVVHGFIGQQRPAEHLGHHQPVFKDVTAGGGVRVVGTENPPVAERVEKPTVDAIWVDPVVTDHHSLRVSRVVPLADVGALGDRRSSAAAALAQPIAGEYVRGNGDSGVLGPEGSAPDVVAAAEPTRVSPVPALGPDSRLRDLGLFSASTFAEAVPSEHVGGDIMPSCSHLLSVTGKGA